MDKTQASFYQLRGPDNSKYDVKGGKIGKYDRAVQPDHMFITAKEGQTRYSSQKSFVND